MCFIKHETHMFKLGTQIISDNNNGKFYARNYVIEILILNNKILKNLERNIKKNRPKGGFYIMLFIN